jgi:chromosome segregation ATPase
MTQKTYTQLRKEQSIQSRLEMLSHLARIKGELEEAQGHVHALRTAAIKSERARKNLESENDALKREVQELNLENKQLRNKIAHRERELKEAFL